MELSKHSIKTIENIKLGKRVSGVLISKIPDNDKLYLKEKFNAQDFRSAIYCLAHEIEPHKCENCGIQTELDSFKVGFRRFCSVSCSLKHNNRLNNKQKNIQRAEKQIDLIEPILNQCAEQYLSKNNSKTIKEIALENGISHFSLYNFLSKSNLKLDRTVIKSRKHKLNTELTETDYMHSLNFNKVWDCGQLVYILNNINTN